MKDILVSIIIPVYNTAAYLPACLDSVLSQSYENLEIILINDGSTDNSLEICNDYAAKDPRIQVISQENKGISAVRNIGLKHIRGEYFLYLDSDDLLYQDTVKISMETMKAYDADIVVHGITYRSIRTANVSPCDETICFDRKQILREYIISGRISSTVWGKFYKSKLFDHIRFPVDKMHEDAYVMPEVFDASDKTVCIPDSLYIQNIRQGSLVRRKYRPAHLDLITCEEHLMEFIELKYPDLYKYVAYRRADAIAALMGRIVSEFSLFKHRSTYRDLRKKLLEEYRVACEKATSESKINPRTQIAAKKHFMFVLKYTYNGIVVSVKSFVKKIFYKKRVK